MEVRSKIQRFGISLIVGGITGIVVYYLTTQWLLVSLVAWDVLVVTLLALHVKDFHGHGPGETARIARQDNIGRSVTDVILVIASLASLGAVLHLLASHDTSVLYIAVALSSIILSWAMIHALYALRYAVMYYDNKRDGIDFSGEKEPTFVDFAYVAYTIGMTYQVSDTTMTSTRFRRVALGHAFLSFLFGVAIIAISINFIASLGK